jgi:hypothetical protein
LSPPGNRGYIGRARLALVLCLLSAGAAGQETTAPAEQKVEQADGEEYHTPRAGEALETDVFGRHVIVPERDRRSITAWDLGLAAVAPGITGNEVLPFASLYFWRHPDENTLLRAVVVGVYDEIFYARSTDSLRPFEGVFTLHNQTVPFPQSEKVDGERIEEEELYWGYVRPGIGFGYRRQLEHPGHQDNMLGISLFAEPGALYSDSAHDTAKDFIEPQDTFEIRSHAHLRLDALERNLLELPHEGFAVGADLVHGYRSDWDDWGRNAREDGSSTRDYVAFAGYIHGATGVPFASERHRLLATLHGGSGDDLDRFSAFRVGGGPSGEEFGALGRPILPGAAIDEFATSHYAILVGEYRWEPIFFAYLSLRGSLSYVNRERLDEGTDRISHSDDFLASVGARITTGFFFESRLQLDYNYNAGVIRRDEYGGHEVVVHISASF